MKEHNLYKDPAVLWYPKDFISETQLLTMEERGILMTLRATFFVHGRLSKEKIEKLMPGGLSTNIKEFIREDSNGNYYCPVIEEEIRKRREFKKGRSEDGKKGNKVKKLMKEGMTKEEARSKLSKEGEKFGKDKYMGSDTGSVRNKENAIGDAVENKVNRILEEIIFKQETNQELTDQEKKILTDSGFLYQGQFDNIIVRK